MALTRIPEKQLSRGLIVLISFCLALACVFLIVAFGIILNKVQRRRQGYVRAPSTPIDRPMSLQRVPPEYLFGSLKQSHPGAPAI
jgi:Cortical protein marker for cell polarity